MTARMTGTGFNRAMWDETSHVLRTAETRDEGPTLAGLDDERAAQLGRLHELPSLGEVLSAWATQRQNDECEDYAVDFNDLLMAGDGTFRRMAARFDEERGLTKSMPGNLPMTYRVFGNVIRHYCAPRRNVAANLILLPTSARGPGHAASTSRVESTMGGVWTDSPLAIAYNAFLDRKKAVDASVTTIDESAVTELILRTRLLNGPRVDGEAPTARRVVIGAVTPSHCLQNGDDDKLIAALSLAFAGHGETGRAIAFRGVEESELRAVFPALTVEIPNGGAEKWVGYITARNSESGKKSWAISAGLYRAGDSASFACEAVVRTGRHVGSKVAERMVEVAEGAAEMLKKLLETVAELAGRTWDRSTDEFLKRMRAALDGTPLHDPDTACLIAWALGAKMGDRKAITIGDVIDVLGQFAGTLDRRVDARPVEVMLGRLLVDGWKEFRAAGTEKLEDGSEEG